MSQSKKTYTLGKIKQLIDLNGDSTNFDLSFKVTCQDDTPYNLLVVDQTTLDNTPELQYKEARKSISGNIVADKNVYQNYFLILKSEKPCVVDVELTKKVLPKTPSGPIESGPIPGPGNPVPSSRPRKTVISSPPSSIPWKKIGLIALVVVIGLGILWCLYKRKGKETDKNEAPFEHSYTLGQQNFDMSPVASSRGNTPARSSPAPEPVGRSSHKQPNVSPAQSSSGDHRGYRPKPSRISHSFKPASVSPDVMSQASHQSSTRSDAGGNSLLHRLRKFAR